MKIAFGIIVFESPWVLKQLLETIYPFAYQILIAEGPVEFWKRQGRSNLSKEVKDILHTFPDPQFKITIVHGSWPEKDQQSQSYMRHIKDDVDYLWQTDADELYIPEDINTLTNILEKREYSTVGIRSSTFFGGFDHTLNGFEIAKDQFIRIHRVYPGSTWEGHRPPKMIHKSNVPIQHLDSENLFSLTGITIKHYSYCWPEQVKRKIFYYKEALTTFKVIPDYFNSVWIPWVKNKDTRSTIEATYLGVHEWLPQYRGPCFPVPFVGKHPPTIERDLELLTQRLKNELISNQ